MRRWLIRLAAGISAVLFVASAALWVRTYSSRSYIVLRRSWPDVCQSRRTEIGTFPGEVCFSQHRYTYPDARLQESYEKNEIKGWQFTTDPAIARERRPFDVLGFSFQSTGWEPGDGYPDYFYHFRSLTVPLWFLLCTFGVLPLLACVRARRGWVRRGRRRRGLCTACGYDLRASPDQCPECGASAPRWTRMISSAARIE
jgi:hypothetical protein